MKVKSYRDLTVWQSAMELVKEVYALTRNFPKQEIYGIIGQIQRAAVSIPANIAEGHARNSTKEFIHHISIARGSLAELEILFLLADKLHYCQHSEALSISQRCDEIGRMLSGLRNSLKQKVNRNP